MKLHYWQGIDTNSGHIRNFGDELNPFIWKRLLGDIFDENEESIFIGIGSLLNDNLERDLPGKSHKLIFGTGVGYGQRPLRLDDTYKIYCVRGPLSAKALKLEGDYAITDSALLIRHFVNDASASKIRSLGYILHWTNHTSQLKRICENHDIYYIDPTESRVECVIEEIQSCEVILAEAMHGAIIADSLRVPWVPIKSTQEVISFKWQDWCQSIKVPYEPESILPLWEGQDRMGHLKNKVKGMIVSRQLATIKQKYKPVLSDANILDTLFDRLNEKVEVLKQDLGVKGIN